MTAFDFDLLAPIKFFDGVSINSLTKHDIEGLLDKPLFSINEDVLTLNHDDGRTTTVQTIREYRTAIDSGFYPYTTYAMKTASAVFEVPSGILNTVAASKIPTESYINDPRLGVVDLSLMPVKLLSGISPENDGEQFGADGRRIVTIQDAVDNGFATVKQVSSRQIIIEQGGEGFMFRELMRGMDTNDDGIEDLLVFSYNYAVGGTLGAGSTMVLTRRSEEMMFEVVGASDEDNN